MKKYMSLALVITILLSSFSFSFAENTSFRGTVEGTIGRIIDNSIDNIRAVTEMLSDLIEYTTSKFSDISSSNWFVETVSKLVGLSGIDGYSDGTFRPNKEMTKAEFVKTIVASLGFDEEVSSQGHWASNYIKRAKSIGILNDNESAERGLDKAITRNEMAEIAAKTLRYLGEDYVKEREDYSYQIKDFDKIPIYYRNYVLVAYTKGIIKGYPDGNFQGDKGLTRAEASTVIIRILDPTERQLPPVPIKKDNVKTRQITDEDIKRIQGYPLNPMYYVDKEGAVKKYKGFDEYYRTEKNDCALVVEIFTPYKYTPSELKGKDFEWFSSPKLIYRTFGGYYGIRGIVQKYENGKIYEADFELMIENYVGGTTLENEYSGRLNEWKEVR